MVLRQATLLSATGQPCDNTAHGFYCILLLGRSRLRMTRLLNNRSVGAPASGLSHFSGGAATLGGWESLYKVSDTADWEKILDE